MSISGEGSLYAHSNDNEYYIKLSVGTPPQDLLLVMDTGSVVIWAPCTTDYVCNNCRVFLLRKSSSAVQVKCADPKCKDLCGNGNERGRCYGSIHNCSTVCPAYQLTMAREPLPGYLLFEIPGQYPICSLPRTRLHKMENPHFFVHGPR